MKLKISLLMLTLSFLAKSSVDGFLLLKTCESALKSMEPNSKEVDKFNIGYCSGLVQGVQYSLLKNGTVSINGINENDPEKDTLCFDKEGNTPEMIEAVIAHIKRKPEKLNNIQQSIIEDALIEFYSCNN